MDEDLKKLLAYVFVVAWWALMISSFLHGIGYN